MSPAIATTLFVGCAARKSSSKRSQKRTREPTKKELAEQMKVLKNNLEEVTMERDELRKQAQAGGAPAEAVEVQRHAECTETDSVRHLLQKYGDDPLRDLEGATAAQPWIVQMSNCEKLA